MIFLFSTGTAYKTHNLIQTEQFALEAGYDGIELMMPPRNKYKGLDEEMNNYANLTAVKVVHAPNDFYDRKRFAAALHDAVEISKTVGAPLVNIHPASKYFGGKDTVEYCIEQIQKTESSEGITIAYEVLGRALGNDAKWRKHISQQEAYKHPSEWVYDARKHGLSATLDTSHIATWDEDPTEYAIRLGRFLKHIHLSDFDRISKGLHLTPGAGCIDLKNLFMYLTKHFPNITVTIEVDPCDTPEKSLNIAQQSILFVRELVTQTRLE